MEEVKKTSETAKPSAMARPSAMGKRPKKNLNYERDRDRQPVKGIFRFYEVPGGTMKFALRLYKGDHARRYKLVDGEVCSVPLGVAKHLNSSGWYPIHAHVVDANGKNIYKVNQKKQRYGFQSLEFIDPADFAVTDNTIVTATNV